LEVGNQEAPAGFGDEKGRRVMFKLHGEKKGDMSCSGHPGKGG